MRPSSLNASQAERCGHRHICGCCNIYQSRPSSLLILTAQQWTGVVSLKHWKILLFPCYSQQLNLCLTVWNRTRVSPEEKCRCRENFREGHQRVFRVVFFWGTTLFVPSERLLNCGQTHCLCLYLCFDVSGLEQVDVYHSMRERTKAKKNKNPTACSLLFFYVDIFFLPETQVVLCYWAQDKLIDGLATQQG